MNMNLDDYTVHYVKEITEELLDLLWIECIYSGVNLHSVKEFMRMHNLFGISLDEFFNLKFLYSGLDGLDELSSLKRDLKHFNNKTELRIIRTNKMAFVCMPADTFELENGLLKRIYTNDYSNSVIEYEYENDKVIFINYSGLPKRSNFHAYPTMYFYYPENKNYDTFISIMHKRSCSDKNVNAYLKNGIILKEFRNSRYKTRNELGHIIEDSGWFSNNSSSGLSATLNLYQFNINLEYDKNKIVKSSYQINGFLQSCNIEYNSDDVPVVFYYEFANAIHNHNVNYEYIYYDRVLQCVISKETKLLTGITQRERTVFWRNC